MVVFAHIITTFTNIYHVNATLKCVLLLFLFILTIYSVRHCRAFERTLISLTFFCIFFYFNLFVCNNVFALLLCLVFTFYIQWITHYTVCASVEVPTFL